MPENYFETTLRNKNLKLTPQRLDLIKVLKKLKDNHPTFNELYRELESISPNISRSTLHTNLKAFEKHNLLTTFNHNNETHYELNHDLHVNVIKDGTIYDVKDDEISTQLQIIRDLINEKHGEIKKFTLLVELD